MMHQSTSMLPDKLAQGLRQFEQWRRQREGRGRVPDHLWSLAVELAREFGVSLGRTNYCLQASIQKGLVKAKNFQNSKNEMDYACLLMLMASRRKSGLP